MRWAVPVEILQAAAAAKRNGRTCANPISGPGQATSSGRAGSNGAPENSIDLRSYDSHETDPVAQANRVVNALYDQLQAAFLAGTGDIDLLQERHRKALEMKRRIEMSEFQKRREAGEYIARAQVELEYTEMAVLLKRMRESMVRRVLERCGGLSPSQREIVRGAVESARSAEDRIFRKLPTLTSNDEFLAELAAA